MAKSRREFLAKSSIGLMAAAFTTKASAGQTPSAPATPGAPPTFVSATPVGPAISVDTLTQAEKLVQVEMTPKDLAQAAASWQQGFAPLYERRTGPRKTVIADNIAPAAVWNPTLPGMSSGPGQDAFTRAWSVNIPLPADEEAIAYAPVTQLALWLEQQRITSERLTQIYLKRLRQFNPKLNCVITLCEDHALEQARRADKEIALGHYKGPLHGIPWGAKDLLDTAGIKTTWGAEPYRDRVPEDDATVVKRLNEAGAVLVAKLSLGALALNDVWFGGQTMNPWLPVEGASGSSAGPASAVAAGLVGFAIGSETQGSIVSPSMRCGVTGLRPTFGRVPRSGAMTLSWSCDKLGPMARCVEDTMLVLKAVTGPDGEDTGCVPSQLAFDGTASVKGLKVGYIDAWMKEAPATDVDRAALATVTKLGMEAVPVTLPNWAYDSLNILLLSEAAAAFEELTLSHGVDQLKEQTADAWPNTFRSARFLSAVDFVQADRLRRKVAVEMARVMGQVDLLLVPSLRDEFLVITNFTGHPSLTLRAGFVDVTETRTDWAPGGDHPSIKLPAPHRVPHGVTLVGRLFEEGTMASAGIAMETAFAVAEKRPEGF